MNYRYAFLVALLLLPTLTFAQTGSLQGLITGAGGMIGKVLIPLILGFAFLMFAINAVRFFIIGGNNDESQQNAKALALYSLAAFVFIIAFWGIVGIVSNGVGLENAPCRDKKSDYVTGVTVPCR